MHVQRGLINLPLSLPSIPIVNPLVTALVGNSNQGTTKQPAGTTTTPVSEPTTTPDNGSGGTTSTPSSGSGSGSGNGSSGGGSDSGSSSNGGGYSGPGNNGGGDSGSSDNGGGDSGSNNNGGGNSGSNNNGGSSGSTNTGDSSGNGGNPASNGGSSSNNGSPSGSSSGHTLVANAGNQAPPLTDADSHSSTKIITTIYSNGTPIATQTQTQPIISSGPGNVGGTPGDGSSSSANNASPSSANGDTSKHAGGLSGGAIAGIIIALLIILLTLLIVFLRKRSRAQRTERRQRWWQGRSKHLPNDLGGEEPHRWSAGGTGDATIGSSSGSGIVSARSSFATTFDHANGNESSMVLDFTSLSPPMPPMAEIRDAHGPGLLLHSQDNTRLVDVDSVAERRVSTYSNRSSTSSDIHAQYLAYSDPFVTHQIPPSPMSVRPFSPSDLFSFPKPPTGDHPPPSPQKSVSAPMPIPMATPDSPNPFADPTPQTEEGIEVIRRPFTPTLHDEISVEPGDRVRISKVFDDGWALIEKYPISPNDSSAKGKGKQIQGLIPIDCLRDKGEDLPSFVANMREGRARPLV